MNFYRTILERAGLMPDASHFDTLGAAHESAKHYGTLDRPLVRIELIDVPNDKAGVLSLSETLAAELSGTGINVTVLCPTFVKTNIVAAGRISEESTQLADRLMRWTGLSPQRVARTCLDTNDRGGLYCLPQVDARIGWGIKRFTPTVYTRAVGLTTRLTNP